MGITPEEIAEMDQSTQLMVDTFPGLWWGLFKGCTDRGFTREEALELVKIQIRTGKGE